MERSCGIKVRLCSAVLHIFIHRCSSEPWNFDNGHWASVWRMGIGPKPPHVNFQILTKAIALPASRESWGAYLSRWPRRPHGGHSCVQTSPEGSTGLMTSHCLGTAHHPEGCVQPPPQSGHPPGHWCFLHSPAAGTPRGQLWGPRDHRTWYPTCHCGRLQLALHILPSTSLMSERSEEHSGVIVGVWQVTMNEFFFSY